MQYFNPFNVTPQAIQIFLEAAKSENFSAAAKQLHISQPFVSRTIAILEHEIGFPLFIRNNKRVSLSVAGSYLMNRWERSYQSFTSAVNDAYEIYVKNQNSLTIVDDIETDKNLYLFPIINEFKAANPGITINIEASDVRTGINQVFNGIADIGFIVKGVVSEFADMNIDWKVLIDVPTIVDVPSCFPQIYNKTNLTVKDLDGIPIMLISPPHAVNYNADVLDIFRDSGVEPTIHSYASSRSSLFFKRNFAEAVFIGSPFYSLPANRDIRRIPCEGNGTGLIIYWNKNSTDKKVETFVDIASNYFSGLYYQDSRFIRRG